MKRYTIRAEAFEETWPEEDDDGVWVKFEDHEAEVKRLKGSRVQTRVNVGENLNRCMELRNQLRAELKHSPSEDFGDGYSQAQSIFERLHEALYGDGCVLDGHIEAFDWTKQEMRMPKTCPGSTRGDEHVFERAIGGHCAICGYGHK